MNLIPLLSSCFLAIGGFLFGYDSGIISSTIAQPHFIAYFEDPSDSEAGGIVSSFTGGAILGSLAISILADLLGRKKTVFIGAVISMFGCALQSGATSIAMLIAGRLFAGIAVGLLSAVVPLYCSEISEPRYRGALSGLLQWMLSWGFFVAQWLGYGCSHVDSHFQWRFPLAFQVIPPLLMSIGIWFLCESPRWLMEKDRFDDSKAVLKILRGENTNDEEIDNELREIKDAIIADRTISAIPWKDIFTRASWRYRLLLGCGVQAFGQLSGVNVINYYGPRIYESLGITTETSLMIIGISGSLSIIYCTIGLAVLDRIGRVKPLIFSATGCGLALVVNAALAKYLPTTNGNQLRAMVAMNFVFSFFFTMTGIISWVYPAEIFPTEIRAKGNSISAFTNWSLNLIFAQVSPIALSHVGFRYFFAFFVFNFCAVLCYSLFYPETKGRTLEDMNDLFGDPVVPTSTNEKKESSNIIKEKDQNTDVQVLDIERV